MADQFNREAEPQRLQAEIDERFGDGAYALMQAQRQQFLRDASQIAADRAARDQRELQRTIRAYQAFVARNHRQPRNGEEIPMDP